MRIGSLFSGAGGLDMAVQAVFGGDIVWHSEVDKAASKVLAYRFPSVPNLGDITQVDWADVPAVDVLCGGFPCQDVSAAGARAGIRDGTRSGLWSVFAEAIDALRPRYVVIENVRGLLSATAHRTVEDDEQCSDLEPNPTTMGDGTSRPILRAAGAVLGDLADLGYDAQWTTVAAADVGAPHRRERVFIVATDTAAGNSPEEHLRKKPGRKVVTDLAILVENGLIETGGALLPTPNAQDGNGGKAPRGGSPLHNTGTKRQVPLTDLPDLLPTPGLALLPTPTVQDGANNGGPSQFQRNTLPLNAEVTLLPTPNASDGSGGGQHPDKREGHSRQLIDYVLAPSSQWGKYEPAIRRWEQIVGPAPAPTEPNKNGNPRLSAAFSEWLMGWPGGWVTDSAIGISRNDQLRIVGNGVCPQQAHAAIRYLLTVCEVDG